MEGKRKGEGKEEEGKGKKKKKENGKEKEKGKGKGHSKFCPKCDWQHSVGHPRKPPIGEKISQKSLTQAELQPILSQVSLPWQRGSIEEKVRLAAFDGPSPKTPYRRKNLAKMSYASRVIEVKGKWGRGKWKKNGEGEREGMEKEKRK